MALDTIAAATYLSLSRSTLERMRVEGNGPKFLKLGRSVRYRQADLDVWMEKRLVQSTSEVAA